MWVSRFLDFITIFVKIYDSMKKIIVILFATLAILSCKSRHDETCVIEGQISNPEYQKIYLVDLTGNHLDSVSRRNDGTFRFVYDGEVMPRIVVMEFKGASAEVMYLPVALEPGKVSISLGEYVRLSGTPLNNAIKKFFDEMQTLVDGFEEISTVEAKENAYSAFYLRKILENDNNPFGDYLKVAYSCELTPEDIQKLHNR